MLLLNNLRQYIQRVVSEEMTNGKKTFNFTDVVIDDSELSMILKERKNGDNTMLITILPQFGLNGTEDQAKWKNYLMFMILEKTSYSDKNRAEFLEIFEQTQFKAKQFVDRMLVDKTDEEGMFCGLLTWLREDSIQVDPVWKKHDCNGWMITVELESNA